MRPRKLGEQLDEMANRQAASEIKDKLKKVSIQKRNLPA